jgi:hypothetical protein
LSNLSDQRCANHAQREAVARCPGCHRYFCRECITEHDDRVWCAACLARQLKPSFSRRFHLLGLWRLTQFVVGLLIVWTFFYLCGRTLLAIPSSFHEGAFLTQTEDKR